METRVLSGAEKRKKLKVAMASAVQNTPRLTTFFSKIPKISNEDSPSTSSSTVPGSPIREIDSLELNVEELHPTPDVNALTGQFARDYTGVELVEELEVCSLINSAVPFPTDRGLFSISIPSDQIRRAILEYGPCKPRGPFLKSNNRQFSTSYYTFTKMGMRIERTWLCYSTTLNKAFCETCWLFADRMSRNFRTEWIEGIDTWKTISNKIQRHEQAAFHIQAMINRTTYSGDQTIDQNLQIELKAAAGYWRRVLERIFKTILSLCLGGIALRGHDESIASYNPGNFLRTINLIAEFDPILQDLLQDDRKKIKYLSPTIQNEVIEILSTHLKALICEEVKAATFFSIIADSTPDVTRTDQVSILLRYCLINQETKRLELMESFLGFFKLESHGAVGYENVILEVLENSGIKLDNCRGQGYDGAATMSGSYSGLQARISAKSKNADFVHCRAHSLDLVICDAVKVEPKMSDFFDLLNKCFTFFHSSSIRWNDLKSLTISSVSKQKTKEQAWKISIKKPCDTRWEAKHNSVFALRMNYCDVLKQLSIIILISKKPDEICVASGIRKHLEKFEFVILLVFWEKLLRPMKITSKEMQSTNIDLEKCLVLWRNTISEHEQLAISLDSIIKEATELATRWGIKPELEKKRNRRQKRFFDEIDVEPVTHNSSDQEAFKAKILSPVVKKVLQSMKERIKSVEKVTIRFEFLLPSKMHLFSDGEIVDKTKILQSIYNDDLSTDLTDQMITYISISRDLKGVATIQDVADFILRNELLDSFPDIFKACLIFLTLPVTVASAERSFSKLKFIKSFARNSMSQDRLSGLALLNIEGRRSKELDISKLINEFAHRKARK